MKAGVPSRISTGRSITTGSLNASNLDSSIHAGKRDGRTDDSPRRFT